VKKQPLGEKSIKTSAGLTIGSRSKGGLLRGVGLADLSIWGRALPAGEVAAFLKAHRLRVLVALPADERPPAAGDLYDGWLAEDEQYKTLSATVGTLEAEMATLKKRGTIAHVMHEKTDMAKAHVLERGEYDKRKDEVQPKTPDMLPPFPESLPRNRLGLAQWLLLQDHPLTTRVTVNRFWQEVFGTGLVRTSGDFGITGELPIHPELLDWLAVEFRETGWDVKRLFRLIVTSATYRQAAIATPEKLAKDPANRLLARSNRIRLPGEAVRDAALAASGLLVPTIGGPSVRPWMPDGVWDETSKYGDLRGYKPDTGAGRYRRTMYTVWKRTAGPPTMLLFDAPNRETCTVKRSRTNTPLQALALLNETTFVEAANGLAKRMLAEGGVTPAEKITHGFRLAIGRRPTPDELATLVAGFESDLARFTTEPAAAEHYASVGLVQRPQGVPAAEFAAYSLVANVIINLDEFVMRE
jgi:hypothetical protein